MRISKDNNFFKNTSEHEKKMINFGFWSFSPDFTKSMRCERGLMLKKAINATAISYGWPKHFSEFAPIINFTEHGLGVAGKHAQQFLCFFLIT